MNVNKQKLRIELIKSELQKIGEMRPGSLNQQYTICGREGCRCQDPTNPKKHGPYYQLSYVHLGKSTTQFVQKDLVGNVETQLKNFKMFKQLTTEWIDLALQIAKEKLAEDKLYLKIQGKELKSTAKNQVPKRGPKKPAEIK